MGNLRAPLRAILPSVLLVACALPPLATPSASPSPTPPPTPSPSLSPPPTPSASPSPTPDVAALPRFAAADLVETTIDGMRPRQHPGTDGRVIAGLLPFAARLQIVMGPVLADELGWYLVTDADDRDLGFEEAWVAAGYKPEPFLVATGDRIEGSPFLASLAGTGEAEHGPISIAPEGDHLVRWVAADPERTRCTFAVSLAIGGAGPVPAIRATIGADLVPGTLQANSFDALGIRGEVFVTVSSDCAWALAFVRVPDPTPEPSASGG